MYFMSVKGPLILIVLLGIIGVFVTSLYTSKQQNREAVAIRERCLAVAEDTRSVFSETSTYPEPFLYLEPTKNDFAKNEDILTAISAFIKCTENDHAFSESHPVVKYRDDAQTAAAEIRTHNSEVYSALCLSDTSSSDGVSISKELWIGLGKSPEEADQLIIENKIQEQSEEREHQEWCEENKN